MVNLVDPEISEMFADGQLRPEALYRTRRSSDRPATKGVTTSSSALFDNLEGEEPTPGGGALVAGDEISTDSHILSGICPSFCVHHTHRLGILLL